MALTRKLLFALRAGYYEEDVVPTIIGGYLACCC